MPGGLREDKFRIKVRDKDQEDTMIYDNQIDTDDLANLTDPGTLSGGGSIVIHKENKWRLE